MFELRGRSLLRTEKDSKVTHVRPSSATEVSCKADAKVSSKISESNKTTIGADDSFRKSLRFNTFVSRVNMTSNISSENSRKVQHKHVSESDLVKNLKEQITCLEEQVECLKKQQLLHNKLFKSEFLSNLTPTKHTSPVHKSATTHNEAVVNVKIHKYDNAHQSSNNVPRKQLFNSTELEEVQNSEETLLPLKNEPCTINKESTEKAVFDHSSVLHKSNLLLMQMRCDALENELVVLRKAKESALEELADARVKLNSMSFELILANKERDTLLHQLQQLRSQREIIWPSTNSVEAESGALKLLANNNENGVQTNEFASSTESRVENILHQREFYKLQVDRLQDDNHLLQTQIKLLHEKLLSQASKLITTEVRLRATEDEVQCLKIAAERFNLLCANIVTKNSTMNESGNADVHVTRSLHHELQPYVTQHDKIYTNGYGINNAVHELKEWEHELEQNLHYAGKELQNRQNVEQLSEAKKESIGKLTKTANIITDTLSKPLEQHEMITNESEASNAMNIRNVPVNNQINKSEEKHQEEQHRNEVNDDEVNDDDDDDSVVILNEEALEQDERSSHSLVTKEIEEEKQELIAEDKVASNNANDAENILDLSHRKEEINYKNTESVISHTYEPKAEFPEQHVHCDDNKVDETHNNCATNKPTTIQSQSDLQEHMLVKNTQEEKCKMEADNMYFNDAASGVDVTAITQLTTAKLTVPLPPPPPPPAIVPSRPTAVQPDKIGSEEVSCDNDNVGKSNKRVPEDCANSDDLLMKDGTKNSNDAALPSNELSNAAECTNANNTYITETTKDMQHNLLQTIVAPLVTINAVPVPESVPVAEMSILDQLRALESEIAAEEASLQVFLHKHKEE